MTGGKNKGRELATLAAWVSAVARWPQFTAQEQAFAKAQAVPVGGVGRCRRLVAVNWNDFKQLHKGTFSSGGLLCSKCRQHPQELS